MSKLINWDLATDIFSLYKHTHMVGSVHSISLYLFCPWLFVKNLQLLISFIFISSPGISVESNAKGFSIHLIHIDSQFSPYRNRKGESFAENTDLKSTLSRHAYIWGRQQKMQPNDFVAPHISDRITFIANLSIGDPTLNVYVQMDTGSELLWVQCAPCDICYDQPDPLYDRTNSGSFTEMGCYTSLCLSLGLPASSPSKSSPSLPIILCLNLCFHGLNSPFLAKWVLFTEGRLKFFFSQPWF